MTDNINNTTDDFTGWLNHHLVTSNDTGTVDLISAGCGCGKSTSLTHQIAKTLKQDEYGIIIITDECDRLDSYMIAKDSGSSYLTKYLTEHRDDILIVKASNIKDVRQQLTKKKVVLLITQRYVNMSRSEIQEIVESKSYPKRYIFVDERFPLTEYIRIDDKFFNDIDSKLRRQLDNTCEHKSWLIGQWEKLRNYYNQLMIDLEGSYMGSQLYKWYTDDRGYATINDDTFEHLMLDTYLSRLRANVDNRGIDNNYCKKIRALLQLTHSGGLFVSHKRSGSKSKLDYGKSFIVPLNHSDLLIGLNAKTIIFDGTGSIDPTYKEWYVNHINCSQFQRDLSKLTVNIFDVNTSKNAIGFKTEKDSEKPNEKLGMIIDYSKSKPKIQLIIANGKKPDNGKELQDLKTIEAEFYRNGFNTTHFPTKGGNEWRDIEYIQQVGLNRKRPEYYYAMAINNAFEKTKPGTNSICVINPYGLAKKTMLYDLLADIEQNLFRGCIRNPDNQKDMTFDLLFQCKPLNRNGIDKNDLTELSQMIKDRYEPMGATVNVFDTPNQILVLKTKNRKSNTDKKTKAQTIIDYIEGMKAGTEFKTCELLKTCQLTQKQLDKIKAQNKAIDKLLYDMKIGQGRYRKAG